jgi:branched-chain amino acid transport system permease protein
MDSRLESDDMTEPVAAEGSTATSTVARAGTGTTRVSRWTPSWLLVGLAVMALSTLYFSTKASSANLFTFNSCLLACFGAIALNVLMGTAGQISIGNSAFLAVGGFATIFFLRLGLPFPADVIAAGLAAGVVGLIVGLPALRLRGLQLALATLAAFYIVYYLANEYQSKAKNAGSGGFSINPLFQSKGLVGAQKYWAWLLFGLTAVLIILASRVTRFRSGREWRVIRDHETAAPALGIAVTRSKMTVFALSSVVIGFQGGLTVYLTGSVSADDFTLLLAVSYIAMVVIGGLDSIAGAVIGAAIVTGLPTIVPHVVSSIIGAQQAAQKGASISEIVYGMLVIIFVTSSQRGIVGWFRRFRRVETSRQQSRGPAGLLGLLRGGQKGDTDRAEQLGSGAPAAGRKSLLTVSYKD